MKITMGDGEVIDFPDVDGLAEFKPCVVQFDEVGCTEMLLADCLTVWVPWTPNVHGVDLGYDEAGKLVGIRIWDRVENRKQEAKEKADV